LPGNNDAPRVSTGAEWKPGNNWPSILTGFSYDAFSRGLWSVGFGYSTKFLDFYISTRDILTWFSDGQRQSLSIVMHWYAF
jgi:hypothetical protein